MKPCIFIENEQKEQTPFRGYKSALRRAIEETLKREGFIPKAEISVTLVSSEEICRLNREFRGVDRPTDVLSFPLTEEGEEFEEKEVCLGDIILCPKVIFSQAKEFGTSYRQEMCLMAIHSTLHLLGWDHMEEKEKEEMFARQEAILSCVENCQIQTEQERMEIQ